MASLEESSAALETVEAPSSQISASSDGYGDKEEKRAPLTVSEKVEKAEECRQKGNDMFKAGEFKKAVTLYARVFAYTTGLKSDPGMAQYQNAVGVVPATAGEIDSIDKLEIATWGNTALCHVKLGNGPKALENTDKVLAKDPENGKALCNKGRALILLKELDKAKVCLTEAQTVLPDDKLIAKELRGLPALYEKERQKEKSTWAAAFKKGGLS